VELETLEERREVQDMAQAYKMIQGKEKLKSEIFIHVDGGRTRRDADELKLKTKTGKIRCKKELLQSENSKKME
jgi:hypothetical protein